MATNKQKQLAKKILQNPSMEMGEAMREVGYSENTRPHDVANTESWNNLVERMLPNDKVLLRHAEGLDATKVVSSHTEPDYTVPDHGVRKQYVELAYKVKGKLKENVVQVLNQGEMTVEFIK